MDGILFNPDSDEEKLITWKQLAETLIEKYGKKSEISKDGSAGRSTERVPVLQGR